MCDTNENIGQPNNSHTLYRLSLLEFYSVNSCSYNGESKALLTLLLNVRGSSEHQDAILGNRSKR